MNKFLVLLLIFIFIPIVHAQDISITDTIDNNCPANEDKGLMYFIIFMLVFLILVGVFSHPLLTMLGCIGLFLYSIQMMSCSYIFGTIMAFTSVLLLIYAMVGQRWV